MKVEGLLYIKTLRESWIFFKVCGERIFAAVEKEFLPPLPETFVILMLSFLV